MIDIVLQGNYIYLTDSNTSIVTDRVVCDISIVKKYETSTDFTVYYKGASIDSLCNIPWTDFTLNGVPFATVGDFEAWKNLNTGCTGGDGGGGVVSTLDDVTAQLSIVIANQNQLLAEQQNTTLEVQNLQTINTQIRDFVDGLEDGQVVTQTKLDSLILAVNTTSVNEVNELVIIQSLLNDLLTAGAGDSIILGDILTAIGDFATQNSIDLGALSTLISALTAEQALTTAELQAINLELDAINIAIGNLQTALVAELQGLLVVLQSIEAGQVVTNDLLTDISGYVDTLETLTQTLIDEVDEVEELLIAGNATLIDILNKNNNVTPQCYVWDNLGVDEHVTAYAKLDKDNNFIEWVVLSGVAPLDLTLANALKPCEDATVLGEISSKLSTLITEQQTTTTEIQNLQVINTAISGFVDGLEAGQVLTQTAIDNVTTAVNTTSVNEVNELLVIQGQLTDLINAGTGDTALLTSLLTALNNFALQNTTNLTNLATLVTSLEAEQALTTAELVTANAELVLINTAIGDLQTALVAELQGLLVVLQNLEAGQVVTNQLLTDISGYVDNLEALTQTLINEVDQVEELLTDANLKLDDVNSELDLITAELVTLNTPLSESVTTGFVVDGDTPITVAGGSKGYTLTLTYVGGIDVSLLNNQTDYGNLNGQDIPIGYSVTVEGDIKGGTITNGLTIEAFGDAMWIYNVIA